MSAQQSPLTLETVVCARPNQVSARVDDELVILDLDSSLYFSLDPVGARIFELLQQPTRIAAVVETIVAEFEVDVQTARTDLLALVDTLVAQKLVEARASGAP
jgi:hypothetical protein